MRYSPNTAKYAHGHKKVDANIYEVTMMQLAAVPVKINCKLKLSQKHYRTIIAPRTTKVDHVPQWCQFFRRIHL